MIHTLKLKLALDVELFRLLRLLLIEEAIDFLFLGLLSEFLLSNLSSEDFPFDSGYSSFYASFISLLF